MKNQIDLELNNLIRVERARQRVRQKKKTQDKAGEHSDEQARVQDHKRSCMYWKQAWSQVTVGDFAVESRKFGRRNCKRETIL